MLGRLGLGGAAACRLARPLAWMLAGALCVAASHRPADALPVDVRLAARLDSTTAAQVWAIAESARVAGLPVEPLVGKALEGVARAAGAERIVAAVRRQAEALGAARAALGAERSESEVVAGATVLLAGVPADSLARMRMARPRRSLLIPLVVLADLMARRVPPGAATSVVCAVASAGLKDEEFSQLRLRVERDIAAGADPTTAAQIRGEGLLLRRDGRKITSTTERRPGTRAPPDGRGP